MKPIQGRCPQFFLNYFTFNNEVHSRVTRQSNNLHLPRIRTEQAKKSFFITDGWFLINMHGFNV